MSSASLPSAINSPVLCFSHLRWDFVFQRPQHLMSRFARHAPVFFFEEPLRENVDTSLLRHHRCDKTGVNVLTPVVPETLHGDSLTDTLRALLDNAVRDHGIANPVAWYYTPMMLAFSRHIDAAAVVYDCMDELANFRFAPPELLEREAELLQRANVVFTGGHSLYEAKRDRHTNVHPFPSSVDVAHFAAARTAGDDPADQAAIPHPRAGFFGVIDERMDLELLAHLADARPELQLVMVGPVVKLDQAELPRRNNIHYLGGKSYQELPQYLRGWDIALMPFAINESTRFISPTKTPEYLAGGCPVVSTAITDVKRHYSELGAVSIADNLDEFVAACDAALALRAGADNTWRSEADALLAQQSWDRTFDRMRALVQQASSRTRQHRANGSGGSIPFRTGRGFDDVIVGAGFAGSVLAERLARGAGRRVLLLDRRPHLGGNAYDCLDSAGVLIHQYGPHIFHTNSDWIFEYLSRFTAWRPYEHRVRASIDGQLVPMPINRTTLNMIYGADLRTEAEAAAFLAERAEKLAEIRTSEDVVLAGVGRDLYQRFFRGYTRKQWGLDPSQLDKAVTARVPARTNTDDRYFTDRYQYMPRDGYTRMFENMVDHPGITLALGTDYADVRREFRNARVIYSGPIDEFFDFRFGKLPYRSLRFEHRTLAQSQFQPVAVVNYPSESIPYTRITEYKHLTGQAHSQTSVTYEYPCDDGDPYYPVPRAENHALYKRYEQLAAQTSNVVFVGRLGTYRYYNMDQVVGQAITTYKQLTERKPARSTTSTANGLVQVA